MPPSAFSPGQENHEVLRGIPFRMGMSSARSRARGWRGSSKETSITVVADLSRFHLLGRRSTITLSNSWADVTSSIIKMYAIGVYPDCWI